MVLTLGDTARPSYWTLVQWKPYHHHGMIARTWSRARSVSALCGIRLGPERARDQPSTSGSVTERGRRGYAVAVRRLPPAAMPPPGTPDVDRRRGHIHGRGSYVRPWGRPVARALSRISRYRYDDAARESHGHKTDEHAGEDPSCDEPYTHLSLPLPCWTDDRGLHSRAR
jgi:hypothetical protein